MNIVTHEPFEKNFNDTGKTPNEIPPINPNNDSNKTYQNISILKYWQKIFLKQYKQKFPQINKLFKIT